MAQSLAARLAEMLGQDLRPNPRRLVTRSGFRKRGFHNSWRFGRLPWESAIERQMLARLSQSWLTAELEVQAIALQIPSTTDERGYFNYEPDAIALDRRERMYVLEGKSFDDLQTEDVQRKHRDIRIWLQSCGVTFIEVTERDLGTPALTKNLRQLRRAGRQLPLTRQLDGTRALILRHQPPTFEDLTTVLGSSRAVHALAHGHLTFNIHQVLGPSTALDAQPKEANDAALFIYARPAVPAV